MAKRSTDKDQAGPHHGQNGEMDGGQRGQLAVGQRRQAPPKDDDAQQGRQAAHYGGSAEAHLVDVSVALAQGVTDMHQPAAAREPIASDGVDQGTDGEGSQGRHPTGQTLAQRQQAEDDGGSRSRQIGQIEAHGGRGRGFVQKEKAAQAQDAPIEVQGRGPFPDKAFEAREVRNEAHATQVEGKAASPKANGGQGQRAKASHSGACRPPAGQPATGQEDQARGQQQGQQGKGCIEQRKQ